MKRRLVHALACLAVVAAGPASSQSIKITSVTPASGNFPMSGSGVVVAFDYNLAGTPDGQVAGFLKAVPAPGPGQTGFSASFASSGPMGPLMCPDFERTTLTSVTVPAGTVVASWQ